MLRTLVGTRAIRIDTGDDFSLLLEDGDTVPISQTRIAIDVPAFAEDAESLLSEIDSDVLNTFLASLTELTRDQREEVARAGLPRRTGWPRWSPTRRTSCAPCCGSSPTSARPSTAATPSSSG